MADLSRGDRRVYSVVVALACLAVVPPLVGAVSRAREYHPPIVLEPGERPKKPAPPPEKSPFERHGPYAALGASVAVALVWEYGKWLRRTWSRLIAEEPLPTGPALAFASCVALPLGVPFALGAVWGSARLAGPRELVSPFDVGPLLTGAVTFVVALGLFGLGAWAWVASARARRAE